MGMWRLFCRGENLTVVNISRPSSQECANEVLSASSPNETLQRDNRTEPGLFMSRRDERYYCCENRDALSLGQLETKRKQDPRKPGSKSLSSMTRNGEMFMISRDNFSADFFHSFSLTMLCLEKL